NPNTTYYWQIYVEDQYGNTDFSPEYSTKTLEPQGTDQRPFIYREYYYSTGEDAYYPYTARISTDPTYAYNYTVDWGDGNIVENVTGDISHTYEEVKEEYEIKINGVFPKFRAAWANPGNWIVTEIIQWGDIEWLSFEESFMRSGFKISAVDTPDLTNCVSLRNTFRESEGIYNSSILNWDVSNIEDMSFTFHTSGFNMDISNWDVSNVTNMSFMFAGGWKNGFVPNGDIYRNFFNQDISNWNVSNVTNMSHMFASSSFNQNISAWDVRNVTDMSHMFSNGPFNQNISSWNVSKVENMSFMFSGQDYLEYESLYSKFDQPIGSWDVSNVEDMSGMFLDNEVFNQDISQWNVVNVNNMQEMFFNATSFNQNLSSWMVNGVMQCSSFSNGATFWSEPKPVFPNCNPN
ncbi:MULTISPECIES: BspA family leucine-rich repeat surface protein, partial [unclassified Robiginitalea]